MRCWGSGTASEPEGRWQAVIRAGSRCGEAARGGRRPIRSESGALRGLNCGRFLPWARCGAGSGHTGPRRYRRRMGFWRRSVLPGARPGSRSSDQTPQVLRLVGPNPSQGHRQHDRQRHADALPHLAQPANERVLEPVGSRQPAVHPLHRAALVVEVLPPVARPRHRRRRSSASGIRTPGLLHAAVAALPVTAGPWRPFHLHSEGYDLRNRVRQSRWHGSVGGLGRVNRPGLPGRRVCWKLVYADSEGTASSPLPGGNPQMSSSWPCAAFRGARRRCWRVGLEDEGHRQRVPRRAHRIIVAPVAAELLKELHERPSGMALKTSLRRWFSCVPTGWDILASMASHRRTVNCFGGENLGCIIPGCSEAWDDAFGCSGGRWVKKILPLRYLMARKILADSTIYSVRRSSRRAGRCSRLAVRSTTWAQAAPPGCSPRAPI